MVVECLTNAGAGFIHFIDCTVTDQKSEAISEENVTRASAKIDWS